jgi:3-dehydroquinate synthase
MAMAQSIYAWLIEHRVERGHAIVALGGGMVGDLAGFVAATVLRGIALVQAPTSLLAMVDAAIGGKVAVDLPEGKNLVGAFYQPRLVAADPSMLATLPERARIEGWAEAAKHGLILDEALFRTFEARADALLALEPDITTQVIRRSMAIKADVVSRDERETTGLRMLLNYGHTIGHAIEVTAGYGRYLHGEAVAIGTMGAALISARVAGLPPSDVERQRRLLERLRLPTRAEGLDAEAVLSAMSRDKKVEAGAIRWVLLEAIGRAVIRQDVPAELVRQVVRELV